MSLDFNFSKMIERVGKEEYDRITDHPTEKGKWHPVTEALIWATLGAGFGNIKDEKAADEFADRVLMLQAVNGGYLQGKDGDVYVTREDVHNHIGMWTNVFPKEPATKFYAKLARMALEAGKRKERLQEVSAHELCKPKVEA